MSAEHRAVLRRSLTLRWLRWWLVALLVAVGAYVLGQWQWGKYEDRAARADRVERHYEAAPVPVEQVLDDAPVSQDREWTRVEASGRYTGDDLLVRNRPRDGDYGYEVLSRLVLTDGRSLVVDRGWIPFAEGGATVAPDIPPAPEGEVSVLGWVRLGEPSFERDMPPGQVASINLPEVSEAWDEPVLGGYVVRDIEAGVREGGGSPLALDRPSTGTGPHLAYAIQWWLVIPAGFAVVWFAVRREEREARGEPRARPVKVRIWDEEDA